MSELLPPPDSMAYFETHPDALHHLTHDGNGLYHHTYESKCNDSSDITIIELAMDSQHLARLCELSNVRRFLGALGLGGSYIDQPNGWVVTFPSVEMLNESAAQLHHRVQAYSPPPFKPFDGNDYSAKLFLENLADGTVLVSSQQQLEHDMINHNPSWLMMPPRIFEAMRKHADRILECQDETLKLGRYNTVGRFMNGIDANINLSTFGKLMTYADPLTHPSVRPGLMDRVTDGNGAAALQEMAAYGHHISRELE